MKIYIKQCSKFRHECGFHNLDSAYTYIHVFVISDLDVFLFNMLSYYRNTYMYVHTCILTLDSEVWTSFNLQWYDYQVCGNYCWKPQNTSKNINILPDFTKHTFTTYLLKWIEVTLFNRFTLLSLRFYRSTSILQYSNSTLMQNTEIIFPT